MCGNPARDRPIKTYTGSIRAYSDPEFDDALQEGLDLIAEIKRGNQE
ncbi:hypothetical protein [Streptomyces sp. NPDC017991]